MCMTRACLAGCLSNEFGERKVLKLSERIEIPWPCASAISMNGSVGWFRKLDMKAISCQRHKIEAGWLELTPCLYSPFTCAYMSIHAVMSKRQNAPWKQLSTVKSQLHSLCTCQWCAVEISDVSEAFSTPGKQSNTQCFVSMLRFRAPALFLLTVPLFVPFCVIFFSNCFLLFTSENVWI